VFAVRGQANQLADPVYLPPLSASPKSAKVGGRQLKRDPEYSRP
jgi:hypothetical protein